MKLLLPEAMLPTGSPVQKKAVWMRLDKVENGHQDLSLNIFRILRPLFGWQADRQGSQKDSV